MNPVDKKAIIAQAEMLLYSFKHAQSSLSEMRMAAARTYGDAGGLNSYPLSGGVCDHWPLNVKEEVLAHLRASHNALDKSLQLWTSAGRQSRTWSRRKAEICVQK